MIADYADRKGLPYFDLFTATAEPDSLLLAEPYSNDGLHLTTSGYQLFGRLLYEQLFAPTAAGSHLSTFQAGWLMIEDVTDRDFPREVEQASDAGAGRILATGLRSLAALLKQLEQLQEEVAPAVKIVKMNVQENFQIPAELEISSLPALGAVRAGSSCGLSEESARKTRSASSCRWLAEFRNTSPAIRSRLSPGEAVHVRLLDGLHVRLRRRLRV